MADTNKFVQTQKTTLFGSGISSTDTSITLSNFVLPDGETLITMSDFGSIGFGTIEPGTSREEQISFTGITQNGDDTATLTGVTRGLRFVSPYDEVSDNKFPHAGGSTFVVTNTAGFYNNLTAKGNDETITGKYTFTAIPDSTDTPLSDNDLATKKYVDDNVNGGEVSINKIVVSGTAGQTLTAGQLVYLKVSDSKWWKVDADLTATIDNVKLGITQGTADADALISGGVLVSGIHTTTGLTANSLYYASNTAGAIATSAGTLRKVIGQAISTTQLHFDPSFYTDSTSEPIEFVSSSAGSSDSANGVILNTNGKISNSLVNGYGDGSDGDVTISSPTTLTRNMYYNNLTVNSTLTTDGYQIFVKDTISGSGTIQFNGNNGGNATTTTPGTAGAQSGSGPLKNTAGVAGASGRANLGGSAPNNAPGAAQNPSLGSNGQNGGQGGLSDFAVGTGLGGAASINRKFGTILAEVLMCLSPDSNGLLVVPKAQGQAGGGGEGGGNSGGGSDPGTPTTGAGGGSGASGGIIFIAARNWAGSFTIRATGGNGGNGGNAVVGGSIQQGGGGGGAGGNGGISIVIYDVKTWSGSYNLAGGTGGTGGTSANAGTGSTGSNGLTGTYYEIN